MFRIRPGSSLSLACLFFLASLSIAEEPPASPEIEVPKYLFAAEDTLELPALFHMSEIQITAKRIRIGDIVQSCIEQERANRERIDSWVHTQVIKEFEYVGGSRERAKRQLVREQTDRVFFRKPEERRTVRLKYDEYVLEKGEQSPREERGESGVSISFGEMRELPFYLECADDYEFEIRSREIVGDRVIYEVHLRPKSDFAIAPEGVIWIDTSNFQILREEFEFTGRVPLPVIIKSIGPMIRERERVGDLWVWKRWIVRARLRDGVLKTLARLTFQDAGEIPHTVEAIILFRDHEVNEGWEPSPPSSGGVEG